MSQDQRTAQPGNNTTVEASQIQDDTIERTIPMSSGTYESPDASRVRFALSENSRIRYNVDHNESEATCFVDPFTGVPTTNGRRFSDLSDASEYLRPNAFARHRDTLARIDLPPKFNAQRRRSSNVFLDEIAQRFLGHRDSLVRLHSSQNKLKTVPPKVVKSILDSLTFDDYKNLRLTCHQWLNALPRPSTPASSRLPVEVLQQIYEYLQPCDFDSARHTCRSWFLASLDRRVGIQIMKKGGCYPAFQIDLSRHREALRAKALRLNESDTDHDDDLSDCPVEVLEDLNEEWLISKRLATEARLSPAWHGSGLPEGTMQSTSRFVPTETVHFGKLAFPNKRTNLDAKKFTVSACGRFLLVIANTDIFVYSMGSEEKTLQPRVRLVTGKEVLSVSMDSSSGRYAVAALLEGGVGMCWEMNHLFVSTETASISSEPLSLGTHAEISASSISETRAIVPLSLADRDEERCLTIPENSNSEQEIELSSSGPAERNFFGSDSAPPSLCASPSDQSSVASDDDYFSKPSNLLETVPILSQPTHVYKSLGYTNDGPRSVAVCPQRRCVAFGCRTGIELHWVDALTGKDLNRWFPLAAPSDFLYFLPQRSDSNAPKKLRLISSAAGFSRKIRNRHNSAPKLKSTPSGARHGRRQSMTKLFFGNLPFPSALNRRRRDSGALDEQETQGVLRAVDCDHYHAVPLSDGAHILYTDPTTGHLCLGSDAPLGGPTKLIRKVCMIPPMSDKVARGSPVSYAAAQDLSRGVRVIAAYEDGSLVLYNIPSECFERIRNIRSSPDVWDELSGVMGQSDILMDGLMVEQNNNTHGIFSTADTLEPGSAMSFRSLQINGAFICHTDADVEDIQVDCSSGGLHFWTFHHSGQAKKMDIYAPGDHDVKSHIVEVDGSLRNTAELSYKQVFDNQLRRRRTRKDSKAHLSESSAQRVKFYGLDGASDYDFQCEEFSFEDELTLLEELDTQSKVLHPDVTVGDRQQRPGLMQEKLQVEVLTDWRNTMLLSPYVINLD